MSGSAGRARYGRVAIAFHWTIAALIIVNILIGIFHEDLAKPLASLLIGWHKAIGIVVLVLSIGRLAWRLAHRPPPLPPLPRWQVGVAHALHWGFYFLIIAMPVSGWWMSSAGMKRWPIDFFGLFEVPYLPVTRGPEGAGAAFHQFHVVAGWTMGALVLIHVGAALRHHYIDRNNVLARMLPWPPARR